MAAAAVPAISLGAQYFMNRGKNKRNAQALTSATTGLQGSATDLSQLGTKIGDQAGGFLGDAQKTLSGASRDYDAVGGYYAPMLSGSRSALMQATAPERAHITDTYRGAEKGLRDIRGGTGELARAELNRDRAGKLALLGPSARAAAANGMMQVGGARGQLGATQAGVGSSLFGQAVGAKGGATSAYGTLFGGANYRDAQQAQFNNQAGSGIGSMIFDAVKSQGKKGGAGGVLPNRGPAIGGFPGLPGGVSPVRP